ncbi:hypothetical protein ACH5RR_040555 [Cinchona calisaya]|uniref:Uncharacterized protein n=1 Tax=Cinchona calisaya TaxID=153742 RepID=A0ABD2XWG2_9GENT
MNDILPEEAELIKSIPLGSSCDGVDRWMWQFSKNGEFTVRNAYYTVLESDLINRSGEMRVRQGEEEENGKDFGDRLCWRYSSWSGAIFNNGGGFEK